MIDPLSKGYATAATDAGHQGDSSDARFAAGHPEKLIDFGHRAVHEMTVAAKGVIKAFYDKTTQRSLFVSCSTGGRQALMEAYRYPQDYDGISAMAPANPMVGLMVSSLWTGAATLKDGARRVSPAQFERVREAAVKACDADDGVTDGIISAPGRCRFDPGVIQCTDQKPSIAGRLSGATECRAITGADSSANAAACLTAPQVEALRAIYGRAAQSAHGEAIFPGFERGSEAMLAIQSSGTEPFPAVTSYFRDLVFGDPSWDFRSFDYDKGLTRSLEAHRKIVDIPPTGLDQYFANGRKLLLSHGWADPLIPPMVSVNFYHELIAHLGPKQCSRMRACS